MKFHTQQIQTEQGVLIGLPLPEWQKLLKKFRYMEQKLEAEKTLRSSLKEIKDIKEGKVKPLTLKEFFDEL
jgi:hypothetical protein